MLSAALLVLFPFAMIYAAASDLVSMTIANRVPLVLVAGFVVVCAAMNMPLPTVGAHFAAGALALAVTFFFFAMGWMGGGDAKLIAVTMLWLGPTVSGAAYLLLSSLLGGMLTLGLLTLRTYMAPATGIDFVDRLLESETGIPYGIALGIGGLLAYSDSFWMTSAVAGAL